MFFAPSNIVHRRPKQKKWNRIGKNVPKSFAISEERYKFATNFNFDSKRMTMDHTENDTVLPTMATKAGK
jgi:hypothetical protein